MSAIAAICAAEAVGATIAAIVAIIDRAYWRDTAARYRDIAAATARRSEADLLEYNRRGRELDRLRRAIARIAD